MSAPGVDRSPGDRWPQPREVAAFVERALASTLPDDALRILTLPAPSRSPEALLADPRAGLFWTTPGRPVHAGLGVAAAVGAAGTDRFSAIRTAAEALWPRIEARTYPGVEPLGPRLFGGFSFLPGPNADEWRGFGDARFTLPRVLYTRDGDRARLSLAVSGSELGGSKAGAVAEEAAALLDRLAALPTGADPAPDADRPAARREGPVESDEGREEWVRAVAAIQRRIEAGRAAKIVAARSRSVPLSGGDRLSTILGRLDRESATAARFAFRSDGAVFVGATPERLVGRSGLEVRTEALAGSVSADSPEEEARLLESLKEEAEHAYVVRAIEEALAPLCERLDRPAEPRIQRLRHVLHLQTPFSGRLREPVHILDLVERLHPTPAVGGWPTAEALDWIERDESITRGWYAAPVGWFDAEGDGEFGVALRSGLLHGDRAYLYAGAGIVRHSDADAEYAETEVKLRTMMEALGIPA